MDDGMKIFIVDFLIFGSKFDQCLETLDKVPQRCESSNIVLKCEKYHFKVKEGIVLGYRVSNKGF